MIDGRCASCEFWEWSGVGSIGDTTTGDCQSDSLNEAQSIHMIGHVRTRSSFGCIYWQEKGPDLREQLAKYAHAAWCGWIKHMFRKGHFEPAQEQDRWLRLAYTAYCNLTEDEKESDRGEADRMLAIVKKSQTCPCQP